jgi:hypothetical protein
MTNNLTKSNLSPFVNERVVKDLKLKTGNTIIDKKFNFKDFISNKSNPLPLIPGIYFNNSEDNIKEDNIGSKIINNYYTIKICMKKLLIIKTFILSILDVSGSNDLDKINISREKYKLFCEVKERHFIFFPPAFPPVPLLCCPVFSPIPPWVNCACRGGSCWPLCGAPTGLVRVASVAFFLPVGAVPPRGPHPLLHLPCCLSCLLS